MNPDVTTTAGRIGLLGQRLMAVDGSPFQSLGKGLLGQREDAVNAANDAQQFGLKQQEANDRGSYYRAQIDAKNQPDNGTSNMQDWEKYQQLLKTDPAQAHQFWMMTSGAARDPSLRPPPQQRLYMTNNGYQTPDKAVGMMGAPKQFAPHHASTAPPRTKTVGGKTYVWEP